MFSSLKHRQFRIFSTGFAISSIGTWVQTLATSWLAYKLTGSSFWLGAIAFSGQIPTFIFSLFAGVVVDHLPKYRLLVATQTLSLLQAFLLFLISYTGHINLFSIIFLNIILGTINAFDMNVRQSYLVDMIPTRDDLPNAIALNSSIVNLTRLIGPMMAGLAIASFGVTTCFAINAVSFFAVLYALYLIKPPIEKKPKTFHAEEIFDYFKEGWHATIYNKAIRRLIFFLAITSFFGIPYSNFFAAIAHHFAHTGINESTILGIITAANGFGSLFAAILLARRKALPRLAKHIAWGGGILGIGIYFCLSINNFYLFLLTIVFSGFGLLLQLSSVNTMVQTLVKNELRSRVLSFLFISIMGMSPLGSLVWGIISHRYGLRYTFMTAGSILMIASTYFYLLSAQINRAVRPISQ